MNRYGNLKVRLTEEAIVLFQKNSRTGYSKWKNTEYKFIAPASEEYTFQWLWDTAFHAIVLANINPQWAQQEIRNFLLGQHEDGFLPHIIFWGNKLILPHWAYIESALSLRPRTSSITQPPAFAIAVEAITDNSKDLSFLKEVLPKLAKHHRWLMQNRDIDHDSLIAIISPNESGMDELPVFQCVHNFEHTDTARLHYYYRKADILNLFYNYNSRLILEKDYFNVEEILFNCMFIESSRALSRLFILIDDETESNFFKTVANDTEKQLLDKMWAEEDGIFYSLYSKQERQAKVKTVASLIPFFLDGLKGEQLHRLVNEHLLNSNEFWTNYPVPSVAKDEKYYVPNDTPFYKIKLLWRGPTWINTNWLIVKGLQKHGLHDIADSIIGKMCEMIEREGFREYYNPETGKGYRRKNFGWSTLLLDLI
ncbi:hypothetical protein HY358_02040 [Candidatus Roizmanbacteria bacterium]|nr:hypothetical protein [Candidatus Roizmanbacteria bacterium]